MYTVERAIILAAGFGARMRELTEHTPKPMLRVNGKRLIDICIEGVLAQGIEEVIVIVGYLKERFQEVADAYPQVRLVENPYYASTNNISSIYMVRDYLENSMIIEGDHYFLDTGIMHREFAHSGYNAFRTDEPYPEWVSKVDAEYRILSTSEQGGDSGYVTYGVSHWTPQDARKLKKWLEYEFDELQRRDCYWDYIPMLLHAEDFELYVTPTERNVYAELDSVEQIAAWDSSYEKYLR